MTRLGFTLAAVLMFSASAYLWGRYDGRALCESAHAAAKAQTLATTIRAAELASRIEAERLALEAERDLLLQELEDQAYADQENSCGISAGRVDRLRQR